ncbi:MAG: large-conductance mechanosensitive channel protein MscL [Planctomycetota bacterium]
MGMLKEFREFALKGNMIDMAVGIIIGGAFGGLVKSLVDQVLMPPLGLLIGGVDFSEFKLVLRDAVWEGGKLVKPVTELQYGAFITVGINFVIVAFAVFVLVKAINTARRRFEAQAAAAPAAPPGPTSEQLLAEIRDLLKHDQRAA